MPWALPYVGEEEVAAVTALLRERRLSMGHEVVAFENLAAGLVDRRRAVAVANGTVALDLALCLAGVRRGDRVLVSALSYIATVSTVVSCGAVPVFCDVDPVTLNISTAAVDAHIVGARALLVADYGGSPVDYEPLEAACARAGATLLVDGAQSIGAEYDGRPTIARGLVSTTSFHTAKAFLTGEGGMVFMDDDELAQRCRRLRGQGEIPGRKYVHDTLATNARLTDYAAAIGRVQLGRFDEVIARRRTLAARYDEAFVSSEEVEVVAHLPRAMPSAFSYAVLVPERDRLAADLADQGIETRSLYPLPAYRQPIPEYEPFRDAVCPSAEVAATRVLNLPLFYEMRDDQIDRVASALMAAAAVPAGRR